MSKNIELTRIHAINWFGYQDTFDTAGDLLIAGVTGSGKSILMDLIQLVIVGDQKSKYNQSATGKSSSRTLKSYCLGDTKDEVEGIAQYMRNEGATTYVALEFIWPDNQRIETWGLRIEFDSAAQNSPARRHGFYLPRRMNKQDWCDSHDYPLELTSFKEFIAQSGGKLFDTMESYRREMSLSTHLNFDRETLDYLLPAAMSFTFLDSFNKFCRNYVLPPDKIQIEEVRDSYHAFLSLKREIAQLDMQLNLLMEINTQYNKHESALIDKDLYADISKELACEDLREFVEEIQSEIDELQIEANIENAREDKLQIQLEQQRDKRDLLRDALNETEDGRLFLHIRENNRRLVEKLNQLRASSESLHSACTKKCQKIGSWLSEIQLCGIKISKKYLSSLNSAISKVKQANPETIIVDLEALSTTLRECNEQYFLLKRPLIEEFEKKANRVRSITSRLEQLDRGKLNHRSTLLDTLNQNLPRRANGDPAAFALRELCEVTDEKWRPALEIAFGRKFAVVVEPQNYKFAESIYRELRSNALGESLINPSEALKLNARRDIGSLANHLECNDPVAQSLVDHLLGRIICVEQAQDLVKHHSSILPDGFMYQRPFTERRAHYDNVPCIGAKGLEKQKITLQRERELLRNELEAATPILNKLKQAEAKYRQEKLELPSIGNALHNQHLIEEHSEKLQLNIEQLKVIEESDFEAKEQELHKLDSLIKRLSEELKQLVKSELRIKLAKSQASMESAEEQLNLAENTLQTHRAQFNAFKLYREKREALYEQLIEQNPALDIAATQAQRLERKASEMAITTWATTVELRKDLAREFPIFSEYSPEDANNTIWAERLEKIQHNDIPAYKIKAETEEKNWQNIFRQQVLIKLRSALIHVEMTLKLLNKELKKPIGQHLYQIRKKRNPDYATYQKLVDNSALAEEDGLFFDIIDAESREEIEKLFTQLVEDPNNAEVLNFLDYRNYYDYDMSVADIRDPEGAETSVDKQSGKFSGGESQSPYFIAILACYLRAYHRYQTDKAPSIALVPIDEAFSKLSGERIRDCITALKSLGLQGVFSMSSGNIPYAIDLCDQTMVVSKKETKKHKKIHIRNIAIALTREEAIKKLVTSK